MDKECRLNEFESSHAEMRTQIRSLQIRFEKARSECNKAEAESKRLHVLLQEADNAAMQLELEASRTTELDRKNSENESTIALLSAECKELKLQVMYLTKQLELAVADLETEAKQTEHFTNCFLNLSTRLQDRTDLDQIQEQNYNSICGPQEKN